MLPKSPIQPENTIIDCETPPQIQQNDENNRNPGNDLRKPSTPERLKVPKAFKFPERYTFFQCFLQFQQYTSCLVLQFVTFFCVYFFGRYRSPTDSMMSPVTKGLLARSRKGGMLLPPSVNQTKVYKLLLNYGTFLLANFGVWGSDN